MAGSAKMQLLMLLIGIAMGCSSSSGGSVTEPRRAVVKISGYGDIDGTVTLEQASMESPVKISGVVYGLKKGTHGMHVHQGFQLGDRCQMVGAHFNPLHYQHGGPRDRHRHVGDMGNFQSVDSGSTTKTDIKLVSTLMSLYDESHSNVMNRAVVIHAKADDLGRGHSPHSLKTGDSGPPVACGLIKPVDELAVAEGEAEVDVDRMGTSQPGHRHRGDHVSAQIDSMEMKSAAATQMVWGIGQTYEYRYIGSISTGMPSISPKLAGGSISGRLIIQVVDGNTINIALRHVEAKMFNENVQPEVVGAEPGVPVDIVDKEMLEKAIRATVINGKVKSVAIEKDEPLWTVNFKRALVAQLQLQLDASSAIFQHADTTAYHTMEGSSNGECQTWYHINRLTMGQIHADDDRLPVPELCENRTVYEIVKNRNFNKCRSSAAFNYRSEPGLRCNVTEGAGCENMMAHVDTVRVVGCRTDDSFVVQRIKTMDRLVTKPMAYETESLEGVSIQHFELIKTGKTTPSTSWKSSEVVNVYQTLTYAYDDEHKMLAPKMGQPSLEEVNSPMVIDVEQDTIFNEARRLLMEIVQELDGERFYADPSEQFVGEKLNMLATALSQLDRNQLSRFVDEYAGDEDKSTRKQMVLNALVLSGTNPSVVIIRDWILNGQLKGEEAIEMVTMLPATIKTPTRSLVSMLMDYLKSDVVNTNQQLKIASALSLTRLVHRACINITRSRNMFPGLVMGDFCSSEDEVVVQRLVPWLGEQLSNATEDVEKMAMLAALGNLAHVMILPVVLPSVISCDAPGSYWTHRRHSEGKQWQQQKSQAKKERSSSVEEMIEQFKEDYARKFNEEVVNEEAGCITIRTKAVFALSSMAVDENEVISSILGPIAFNQAEKTQIRMAALSLLFISNPDDNFWRQVALSTWFERDQLVSHYIHSSVASLAADTNPKRRDVAIRAQSLVPMMKPMHRVHLSSVNYFQSGHDEKTRLGYASETINFPGFESFLPSNHYNSLYVTMGPWLARVFDISISSKQPEKLLDQLFGPPSSSIHSQDSSAQMHPELRQIDDELEMEQRASARPEINIYTNLLDNYQRFTTINPSTLQSAVDYLLRQSSASRNEDIDINYHKLLPLSTTFVRIPSSMGLAYSTFHQSRLMTSLKSQLQVTMKMPRGISSAVAEIDGQIRTVVSVESSHQMAAETPFTRSYVLSGVHFDASLALPAHINIQADLGNVHLKTSMKILGERVQIARHAVVPFSGVRRADDFTPSLLADAVHKIKILDQPLTKEYGYGEKTMGLNLILRERGDIGAMRNSPAYSHDRLGSLIFYAMPSTLRYHECSVHLDNRRSTTDVITTSLSFAFGDTAKRSEMDWQQSAEPSVYSLNLSVEFAADRSPLPSHSYAASLAYGTANRGQSHRTRLFVENQSAASQDHFVLCGFMETTAPISDVVRRENFAGEDLSRGAVVQIGFGKSCDRDRKITIEAKMERSEEEIEDTVNSKWQERECARQELSGRGVDRECLSTRRLASILNKGLITIDYNEMPLAVRHATLQMADAFRYWMGPYVSDSQLLVRNDDSHIRIETVYSSVIGSMDLRVYKPTSNTFYHGIEIHPIAEALLPFNPRLSVLRSVFGGPGLCLIDRNAVTTYDGLHYNSTMGDCDQVVTKDCSNRYNMAVLAREDNGKKVVTVYLNDDKIELDASRKQIRINGEAIEMVHDTAHQLRHSDSTITAEIRQTSDGFFHVDSPTHWIRVTCNANEMIVLTSPVHNGRLCGLCGTQTGQKNDDLTGPKKCSLPPQLMSAAYQLRRPEGCHNVEDVRHHQILRLVHDRCDREKTRSTPSALSIHTRDVSDDAGDCTLSRNKMIHRGHKKCFTIEPVMKCSPSCRPAQMKEVTLDFNCMPIGSLSDQLRDAVHRRPLTEMAGLDVTDKVVFHVPRSCVPVAPVAPKRR